MISTLDTVRERRETDLACERLYRRHQPSLVKFACLRGCDEHEAWDVVQELFIRAFRLGMIVPLAARTEERQRMWLLRTLRWLICNHHRSRARIRRGGLAAIVSLDGFMDAGHDIPLHVTPATEHDRRHTWSLIERGLEALRSRSRSSSWPEIERSLCHGAPAATPAARVALHRARARLRDFIRHEGAEACAP